MHSYEYRQGASPLVVSMPHIGSYIPIEMQQRMSAAGRMVSDTDWDLDLVYRFLWDSDATIISSRLSRYVIDLARDPTGKPLDAAIKHPGLVPTTDFDDVPLYQSEREPHPKEIALRVARYWRPYHDRLSAALSAARARHGYAVLFDCHSIRSVVTRYFPGQIPDLNLGTAGGTSCAAELRESLASALNLSGMYSVAVDGVFKGGFITRHYGSPENGIHAFQLEMSRAVYMREHPSPTIALEKCELLQPTLEAFVAAATNWKPNT
ncbi:N-formylglutamate amidohydrolase [Mesorhizobium sp. CO1-1-11]|uniref:N-formylglutamate amidohydrolase n=1 Tax=Mesorhizobium sp. CO1-1-11 TaxID=2876636 RepID=UPI001CCEC615|nr:N-formylglutamate amidohydrolase [Mesorhizobium sp. CO1-1-11]MBZ9726305.1 N-formylglutamate amidohydrolase [Mesorhizobium sp. CO1-1-11]